MKRLTTGRWLVAHVVVLIGIVILINLGLWQLRRLEQRRSLNAEIAAGLNQPVIAITGEAVDPEALSFHRVTVTGTFDNAEAMLIRNRSLNGVPGQHLLVPLHITGSDQAVLVDRGWLPMPESEPERRPAYAAAGEVTINGIAYKTQTPPSRFAPVDRARAPGQTRLDAWFRVDIDRIQEQIPYPLLPIFIRQSPEPGQAADALPRPEGDPALDEGPHLGYAIQWFAFAVILAITYGAFIRQELKGKEQPRISVGEMPQSS
jgi:surfeit locus 1 family protein